MEDKLRISNDDIAERMEKKVKLLLKKMDESGKQTQSELQNSLKTQRQITKDDLKKNKLDMIAKLGNLQLTMAGLVQAESTKVESLIEGS